MQETLKKKLVLPVAILAIVGIAGTTYTIAHSGPTTVHAQTPTVQSNMQVGQDKETQDAVSQKPATTLQQKADTNENDKADTGSSTEVEDGN